MASDFIYYLIKKNLLSEEVLKDLEQEGQGEEGKTIEDIILEKRLIPEIKFFQTKSDFFHIPLRRVDVEEISPSAFEEISEEVARHYKMIPLAREEKILEVGMVNPEDFSVKSALDFIAKQKDIEVKSFLILPSEYEEVIKKYRVLREEIKNAIEELEREEDVVDLEGAEKGVEKIVEEAPVSKIVAVILRHAVEGKASDIHIEPFGEKLRVRFRVDGILYSSLFLEKKLLPSVVSKIKILSNLRIDEMRRPQDGRFRATVIGKRIDFRIATFPTSQGEKVVIRILDPTSVVKNLEFLGVRGKNFEKLKKSAKLPFGSIVFCGPTGSGKTTTQYVILRGLNKESVNIITLEDPVEYWINGINQSQIRPEIGYTFAEGLRQVVRQDPDIIMVGEVRDQETAELVTHAALTGHLVLFTLHTNDAIGAIPRLIDLGVEKFLIPPALKIIVAQRLIRRLCPECKQKVKASAEETEIIQQTLAEIPEEERKKIKVSSPFYIYKPKGCSACLNKGSKGRIGIFEVLLMTSRLEEIILTNLSETNIRKEAQRQNMMTLKQDGVLKALQGEVNFEEVIKSIEIKEQEV